MAEIRSIGIPSPRVEGEEKVGGKALYAVDVDAAEPPLGQSAAESHRPWEDQKDRHHRGAKITRSEGRFLPGKTSPA